MHGSEPDVDTEDSSNENNQRRNVHAKQRSKKSKDVRTPLRSTEGASYAYGGTETVSLEAAKSLASYSSSNNAAKGVRTLGGNGSKDAGREKPAEMLHSSKSRSKNGGFSGQNNGHGHDHEDGEGNRRMFFSGYGNGGRKQHLDRYGRVFYAFDCYSQIVLLSICSK